MHIETSGKVKVATGLTTQGQGHATVFAQLVADELGVQFEDVEVVTGDTRRMPYAVGTFASRAAVMSGSAIHLAAKRAKEKALQDRRRGARGRRGRPRDRRRRRVRSRAARGRRSTSARSRCCPTRCATRSTRRPRRPPSSRVGDPGKPPVAEDDEPGPGGQGLLLARAGDVRRPACTR